MDSLYISNKIVNANDLVNILKIFKIISPVEN